MKAVITFTETGANYAELTHKAETVLLKFFGGTNYDFTMDVSGDSFRALDGTRKLFQADIPRVADMKYSVALLNELIDDYGAAGEIVNAEARAYHEYIAKWQPRPCPTTWRAPTTSPLPTQHGGSSGERRDRGDPAVNHSANGSPVTSPPSTVHTTVDARWDAAFELPLGPRSHRAADTALLAITIPVVIVIVAQLARGFG